MSTTKRKLDSHSTQTTVDAERISTLEREKTQIAELMNRQLAENIKLMGQVSKLSNTVAEQRGELAELREKLQHVTELTARVKAQLEHLRNLIV